MAIHLIVREAFAGYTKGDRIDDADTVESIISGENAANVIRIASGDTPDAEPVPEVAPSVESPHEETFREESADHSLSDDADLDIRQGGRDFHQP